MSSTTFQSVRPSPPACKRPVATKCRIDTGAHESTPARTNRHRRARIDTGRRRGGVECLPRPAPSRPITPTTTSHDTGQHTPTPTSSPLLLAVAIKQPTMLVRMTIFCILCSVVSLPLHFPDSKCPRSQLGRQPSLAQCRGFVNPQILAGNQLGDAVTSGRHFQPLHTAGDRVLWVRGIDQAVEAPAVLADQEVGPQPVSGRLRGKLDPGPCRHIAQKWIVARHNGLRRHASS